MIGLFLFVAFSIPFLTPATNLIAGLETKPLRFGFILLILGENDINVEDIYYICIYLVLSRIVSVGAYLPGVCSVVCLTFLPTPAPLFPRIILM